MTSALAGADPDTRTVGVTIAIPEPWGSRLDEFRLNVGDEAAQRVPAHLTLLGPTPVSRAAADQIERHLARVAADFAPFPLHLRGAGTFRPVTPVVFVAVAAGISECEALAAAVRSGPLTRELNYPYHPHVTVAHDVPAEVLDAAYDGMADFSARFTVDGFTLYEHGEDGYWHPERAFRLAGAPAVEPGGVPGDR
jgi:2'-5' RNA ligase